MVREGFVIAGKLHHASFAIRPGRYLFRRLLQLSNLHLNGNKRTGEGGRGGQVQKQDRSEATFTVVADIYGRYRLVEMVFRERGGIRGREDDSTIFQLRPSAAE